MPGETKPDQTDLVAQNENLTKQVAAITKERDDAKAQVTALTGENTTLKADKATLTNQLATANANLNTVTGERDAAKAEVTKLTGEKTTLEKAVAAKVVAIGISGGAEASASEKKGSETKPQTLTEKVLAAKGCKSLDELESKRVAAEADRNPAAES